MYGYAQDKYLMAKTIPAPDVVDDDDDHYVTLPQIPPPKASQRRRPLLGVWTSLPKLKRSRS
jgi:hypothetical protein